MQLEKGARETKCKKTAMLSSMACDSHRCQGLVTCTGFSPFVASGCMGTWQCLEGILAPRAGAVELQEPRDLEVVRSQKQL